MDKQRKVAVVRGLLAPVVAIVGLGAVGFFNIRIDAAHRGASVDWSNEISRLDAPSPLWWSLGLVVVSALILACVWPTPRTRLSSIAPLISGAVLFACAVWGQVARDPGFVSIFDTGQANSMSDPVPGFEESAASQWLMAGALSAATYALIGAMIALALYATKGSRKFMPFSER